MTLIEARRHALALLIVLDDVVERYGGECEVFMPTWVDGSWREAAQDKEGRAVGWDVPGN